MLTIEEIRAKLSEHHLTLEDLARDMQDGDYTENTWDWFDEEYGDSAEVKLQEAFTTVGYEPLYTGDIYDGSETEIVFKVFGQPVITYYYYSSWGSSHFSDEFYLAKSHEEVITVWEKA